MYMGGQVLMKDKWFAKFSELHNLYISSNLKLQHTIIYMHTSHVMFESIFFFNLTIM